LKNSSDAASETFRDHNRRHFHGECCSNLGIQTECVPCPERRPAFFNRLGRYRNRFHNWLGASRYANALFPDATLLFKEWDGSSAVVANALTQELVERTKPSLGLFEVHIMPSLRDRHSARCGTCR
jgi:hypothetical protein